jgi:NAD-dependent deacetylase
MDLIKMGENPPMCDLDGGILKPDIVLFGEPLPPIVFQEATKKSMECDVMLIAGSSLVVYPAAVLPKLAKDNGAKLILVNMEPTEIDGQCDVVIHDKAGDVLPKIVDAVKTLLHSTV